MHDSGAQREWKTGWAPRLGVLAWSFVGVVAAAIIVLLALAAISEIVLPLLFAAVLAIIFKPLADRLVRRRVQPSIAAGLIVLGLLALMIVVVIATFQGVVQQSDEIGASIDVALAKAADAFAIDQASLDRARAAVEQATPAIGGGFLTQLVSGFGVLVGLAAGLLLGALIMYYLLKEGSRFQSAVVGRLNPVLRKGVDSFIDDSCRILRDYGRGRTVMSAIVAVVIGVASLLLGLPLVFTIVVVNFIGGYIPYIGAFIGGALAVVIALSDGGLASAVIMLLVVLASNVVLENFVAPTVMGHSLDIHPLIVLVVTALGGLLGGIVGLMLAVPAAMIAASALSHLTGKGDPRQDRPSPPLPLS